MSTATKPAPLWHQQPGEGVKAFRAFKAYCHLGPERSIKAAHRAVTKDDVPDVPGRWKLWSVEYKWSERVEAYDDAQDVAAEKAMDRARDKRIGRLEARRLDTELRQQDDFDEALDVYRQMLGRYREDTKLSLRDVSQTKTEIVDGKPVTSKTSFKAIKGSEFAKFTLGQASIAACAINGQRVSSALKQKAADAISRIEYSWCPPEDLINTESDTGPSPASDDSTANKASGKDSLDP